MYVGLVTQVKPLYMEALSVGSTQYTKWSYFPLTQNNNKMHNTDISLHPKDLILESQPKILLLLSLLNI